MLWVIPAVLLALGVVSRWLWRMRGAVWIPLLGATAVMVWWLRLEPSHDRDWSEDVSRLPWAEVEGNIVTLHDVRNFDYPGGGEAVARWETRRVDLADITGIDLAINYWGSPWIAHPIVIFRTREGPPLAFSIETRKEQNEQYSALAGFFRQYELIVVAGTERDLLGVRTCHREGEDAYLYATTVSPESARRRFLEYVETMNALREKPRWYNAVTSNCTTAIRGMRKDNLPPFDWRILINGKGDEMLFERGWLVTDGLPFPALKRQALINSAAWAAYGQDDFSAAIRRGRAGFAPGEVSR